jgi:hypothetical protein
VGYGTTTLIIIIIIIIMANKHAPIIIIIIIMVNQHAPEGDKHHSNPIPSGFLKTHPVP